MVTTLLDPEHTTKEDLALLYRARWNNELDLRSIKTTMQMDVLRCKSPEMVRKEIWAHLLAYNLIRTVIAQAALAEAADVEVVLVDGTRSPARVSHEVVEGNTVFWAEVPDDVWAAATAEGGDGSTRSTAYPPIPYELRVPGANSSGFEARCFTAAVAVG